MIAPYIHSGKIVANADWLFHSSRVEQIIQNIHNGQLLTFIASSTFHHTGVGSFLFYPYFFLYPWAIFKLFFNPITAFYLWYGLIIFVAFVIAFYSMRAYVQDDKSAIIFSLVYVLSSYHLYLGQYVFGEFCAMGILPMVFLGFDRLFFEDSKKFIIPNWMILGSSMALLIYAHILSVIITLEIFVVVLAIYCLNGHLQDVFNIKRIVELSKSILLFVLLSLPLIYLFINDYINKGISSTYFGINKRLLQSLSYRINTSFDNVGWGVGFVLIMMLFVGWYFVKDDCKSLWIYFLGLILFLISTNFFPWSIFQNSFLGVIQLTYRYLSFSSLFLSIIAAKIINFTLIRLNVNKYLGLLLVIIICLTSYVSMISNNRDTYMQNKTTLSKVENSFRYLPLTVLDAKNYHLQFNYEAPYGETDYYPKSSLTKHKTKSIINQIAYIDGKTQKISSYSRPNLIIIVIKDGGKKVNLPIVKYAHTFVKLNGNKVNTQISKRGTVQLNNVPNNSKIEVGYNPGISFYLTLLIAIFSWITLFFYVLYRNNKFK